MPSAHTFMEYHRPPRDFFARSPELVAADLIGLILVRRLPDATLMGGIIVETEAYLAFDDSAAHNRRGKTVANAALFMRSGTIYVHRLRQHHCMDIVTEDEDHPSSVLIRAVEPVVGLTDLSRNRGIDETHLLMSGPGRLCQALGITMEFNKRDIVDDSELMLLRPPSHLPTRNVVREARIGVTQDVHLPLRFYEQGSPFVSGQDRKTPSSKRT